MTPKGVRLIPRIALFSAIIYIFSWATSLLPNINLIFFIVFSTGYMWGIAPGVTVGVVGMGLTTLFNPYGPAPIPIMIMQILGISFSGIIGASFYKIYYSVDNSLKRILLLGIASIICTVTFYIPLNIVDAWMFQPFWERLFISSMWSLLSVGSNILIFTLLFPLLQSFYHKEREVLC